ncbi:MAG: hypothetical protein KatS3mg112_1208 [Thermogutta sp.]|nr:MAG: hypothetical protein KatS3mg112_1208 [Thermogutta sp.]
MRVSDLGLPAMTMPAVVTPVEKEQQASQANTSKTSPACQEQSPGQNNRVPLHRLAEVRIRQGVTRRTMARRMKVDVRTVKREEDPYNDLPLSVLYRWQKALQVPLVELLSDIEEPLSAPVLQRARLLRMMKTARAIQVRTKQPSVRYLADMLVQQLLELMPELADVTPWPGGRSKRQPTLGEIAQHPQKFRMR